jgi:hypothetical protein
MEHKLCKLSDITKEQVLSCIRSDKRMMDIYIEDLLKKETKDMWSINHVRDLYHDHRVSCTILTDYLERMFKEEEVLHETAN